MQPNPAALAQLPAAPKGMVQAHLMEYKVSGTQGAKLWEFWYPPQTLKFAASANYTEQPTLAARVNDWQYGSTSGQKLDIPNLVLESYCLGRSLQPLLDGITELLKAKPAESIYAPSPLLFVFGGRSFGPCILTNVSWDEVSWLSGAAARLQMSISLQEIPKPPSIGTPTEPAEDRQAAAREAEGMPRKPLTLRQRQDGSDKVLEWLRANVAQLPDSIRPIVVANAFRLSTDPDTGDVSIFASDGTALGIVGRWNGRELITENVQEFEG